VVADTRIAGHDIRPAGRPSLGIYEGADRLCHADRAHAAALPRRRDEAGRSTSIANRVPATD
jgi:hypothetical protein